jgi:putative Mn2+ efflux pump MntP
MPLTTLSLFTGLCCAAIAASFSSLYFKSGFNKNILKPFAAYLLVNLLLALAGLSLGMALQNPLNTLAPQAGALLLLVIAVKILIRAFRTKTIQRIFDISKPATLFGLMLVINNDILLIGTALPLLADISLLCGLTTFAVATVAGFILGVAFGKKAGFILANLLDLAAALSLLIISLMLLLN